MIDEQLSKFETWIRDEYIDAITPRRLNKAKALTAIYEIGLGVIGADEVTEFEKNPTVTLGRIDRPRLLRNQLKASQRKAWAKACGVAEK